MKQVFNDRVDYLGFGIHKSFCDVEIYKEADKYLVIMTEPCNESSGTSVTNACETIASDLFHRGLVGKDPEKIVWIEHYPERGFPETFDAIDFVYDGRVKEFKNPEWFHLGESLSDEKVKELLK